MCATAGTDLLERDETLGELEAGVARGFAGDGHPLIVEGEAGVGKTRLLDELCGRRRDAVLLRATAGQYEGDLAFGVARQLLGSEVLVSADPEVPADVDVGAVLHDLFLRFTALAAERPLLIVVDDLHWADEPSVRLLAYLARRLEGQPIALLGGARSGAGDLAALRPPAVPTQVLRLAPLSGEGTTRLLGELLGPGRSRRLSPGFHEVTGGNPFLLQTLARSLGDGDAAADTAAGPLAAASPDIGAWVTGQLAGLGPGAADLLDALAILGDGAPAGAIARIAEQDEATSAAALDALIGAGLLRPDGSAFAHPLVHAAVREAMPLGARSLATRRAARVLAEELGEVGRAATLLGGIPPTGEAWAAELLREAGERALREGAPEQAAELWRRGLEEPLDGARRFETTLALGTLECAIGEAGGLERLRRAQELAPDPGGSARAVLARSRVLQLRGDIDAKISLLETELERLGAADPELGQEIEGELATLAITADSVRARTLPRLRALVVAAREGSVVNPVALAAVAGELALTGEREAALAAAREGLARLGHEARGGAAAPIISSALFVCEAWEEVLAHYEAVLADPRRSVFLAADALAGRAVLQLYRGEVAVAEREARAALELTQDHIVQPLKRAVLADALLERGAIEEALEATAGAAAPGELDDGILGQMLIGARARVLSAAGRHEDAVETGYRARDFERSWGVLSPHSSRWREATALSLRASGHGEEARRLAAESLELARGIGLPAATALARRTATLLDPAGPDPDELRAVAAELDAELTRLEHARTTVELGAALRAAGEVEEARAVLAAGRELAHRCGATRIEQRAYAELIASGARPRRVAVNGREALTPAESRVAELAAGGLANPAIAERLVISRRTVEMHLSNAYRKLDIESRGALAAALST